MSWIHFIAGALVMLGSGAALMTEILWIRTLEQSLGSTSLAVAATTGAFFCAMGVGSLVAGRVANRGIQPRTWLLLLQLLAFLWAVLSPSVGPALNWSADAVIPTNDGVWQVFSHYLFAAVALFIPGFVTGTLVPLTVELLAHGRKRPGSVVAALWASDGFGAAFFALLTGIWLLRHVGCQASFWIAAFTHLVAALLTKGLKQRDEAAQQETPRSSPRRKLNTSARFGIWEVLIQLLLVGIAGLGWQTLWARLLVLSIPGSVMWPSLMIASWILGTGLGALVYRFVPLLSQKPAVTLGLGQILCTAGAWVGAFMGAWLRDRLASARPLDSGVAAELLLSVIVSLPAALAMGVTIPAAVDLLEPERRGAARSTGLVLTIDVVGAACSTLVVPLLLLPRLGLTSALLFLGVFQGGAGLFMALRSIQKKRHKSWTLKGVIFVVLGVAMVGAWLLLQADLRPWSSHQRSDREPVRVVWGPMATAAVVLEPGDARRLYVDRHHGMGGETGVFIERRQAHIPLLLHPRARNVAVIGVGSGNTLGAVAQHDLALIDAAENLSSVLQMLDLFGETNRRVWRDERVRVLNMDGHTMLRRSHHRYDVIIGDLVHPWRSGASSLYSREHLQQVRARLGREGLFCFWLPLHELNIEDLAIVSATFLDVFREGTVLLGHLGWRQPILAFLYGGPSDILHRRRLIDTLGATPPRFAVESDLDSPEDLQSLYVGGTEWLQQIANGAPVTTWNRPELAFRSAATWWRGTDGLGERTLSKILDTRRPVEEVAPDDENATRRHGAVGILLRAELREAAGELEAAARGYGEAALADPTFQLPELALRMLRRRVLRESTTPNPQNR